MGKKLFSIINTDEVFITNNLNIKTKLIISFVVLILIVGSISFYPLIMYSSPISRYDKVLSNIEVIGGISGKTVDIINLSKELFFNPKKDKMKKDYDNKVSALREGISALKKLVKSENSQSLLFNMEKLVDAFIEKCGAVADTTGKYTDEEKQKIYDENIEKLNGFIDSNTNELVKSEIEFEQFDWKHKRHKQWCSEHIQRLCIKQPRGCSCYPTDKCEYAGCSFYR